MAKTKIFGALGLAAVLGVAGVAVSGVNADVTGSPQTVTYGVTIGASNSFATDVDKVTLTGVNGEVATTGSNKLTAITNNSGGYTITAQSATTNAVLTSGTDTIAYTTSAVGTSTSGWNLGVAVSGVGATSTGVTGGYINLSSTAAEVVKATGPTSKTGDVTTITMNAGISANQAAGTYAETVTYTMAETQ